MPKPTTVRLSDRTSLPSIQRRKSRSGRTTGSRSSNRVSHWHWCRVGRISGRKDTKPIAVFYSRRNGEYHTFWHVVQILSDDTVSRTLSSDGELQLQGLDPTDPTPHLFSIERKRWAPDTETFDHAKVPCETGTGMEFEGNFRSHLLTFEEAVKER